MVGPTREWVGFDPQIRVEYLHRYIAGSDQFIEIEDMNGKLERISGPISIWKDPRFINNIFVKDKKKIEKNEAVILYYSNSNDLNKQIEDKMERKILYGPMIYTPNKNGIEYFHQFNWHYPINDETKGLVTQGLVRFQNIRLQPSHFYFDIENVRTKDDVLITVKSMIFYKIINLELMIDSTNDPINVMINS